MKTAAAVEREKKRISLIHKNLYIEIPPKEDNGSDDCSKVYKVALRDRRISCHSKCANASYKAQGAL